MPHKTVGWSICMKNSMSIHKIAGVLCALQSVTNLSAKCNQTPPLKQLAFAARGFGLRPKMCRLSADTENSHRTREKPLVPRVRKSLFST